MAQYRVIFKKEYQGEIYRIISRQVVGMIVYGTEIWGNAPTDTEGHMPQRFGGTISNCGQPTQEIWNDLSLKEMTYQDAKMEILKRVPSRWALYEGAPAPQSTLHKTVETHPELFITKPKNWGKVAIGQLITKRKTELEYRHKISFVELKGCPVEISEVAKVKNRYFIIGYRKKSPFGFNRRYFTGYWDGCSEHWIDGSYDLTYAQAKKQRKTVSIKRFLREGDCDA